MLDVVVNVTESDAGAPVYGTITMNEGTGVDQPIGRITKMPAKRIAWMAVSRPLFEELCGKDVHALLSAEESACHYWIEHDDGPNPGVRDWFRRSLNELHKQIHNALLLPANATVVGVSLAFRFVYNEVAIQIECPDFVETPEGCMMPQTDAMYEWHNKQLGQVSKFVGWSNMEGGKMKEPVVKVPDELDADIDRVVAKFAARMMEDIRGKAVVMPAGTKVELIRDWSKEDLKEFCVPGLDLGQELDRTVECCITPGEVRAPRILKCWRCNNDRAGTRLSSGEWECEECGRKPLL